LFEGDGYEEWHKEAEKRGLPNYPTPLALDA
jgi:glutamine synthetase